MASKTLGSPLPLEVPKAMDAKLGRWAKARGSSPSEVIRHAIAVCRFSKFAAERGDRVQKSFRLPADARGVVKKVARETDAPMADVIRFAIDQLPAQPPKSAGRSSSLSSSRR